MLLFNDKFFFEGGSAGRIVGVLSIMHHHILFMQGGSIFLPYCNIIALPITNYKLIQPIDFNQVVIIIAGGGA
jgi:hypothetical protein